MPLPDPWVPQLSESARAGLAALSAEPRRALVACDYDGTLAPVVDDPAQARPEPGAVEALVRLAEYVGTVAVVTGRPAATAVELGGLDRVPGLVVLGAYGAQRWESGSVTRLVPVPEQSVVAAAHADVAEVLRKSGLAGVRLESKGAAVAVHVRGCPDPEAAQAELLAPLVRVAEAHGLAVEPGRLVVELRPPGSDKGLALRRLVEERLARSVVFVGDDLGDLAAFDVVRALRADGLAGITVASRSTEAPEVAAAADLVVDGPPGVARLLAGLAELLASAAQA